MKLVLQLRVTLSTTHNLMFNQYSQFSQRKFRLYHFDDEVHVDSKHQVEYTEWAKSYKVYCSPFYVVQNFEPGLL